jgi:integrase
MSLVTNVFRRGASYYFRTRVPARFRALLVRKELWRSLRTTDAREARQRASIAVLLTEALWRDLERAMSSKRDVPNPAQIRSLVDHWLRSELDEDAYLRTAPEGEWHDGVILRTEPGGVADVVVEYLDDSALRDFRALSAQDQNARLGLNGYLVTHVSDLDLRRRAFRKPFEGAERRHKSADGALAEQQVAEVFRRAGYDPSPFSEAFELATRRMIRAHSDVLSAINQRDEVEWRPELDDDPVASLLGSLVPAPMAYERMDPVTPSELPASVTSVREAATLMLREARKLEQFAEGRATEYDKAVSLFVGWHGSDPDVGAVTPAIAGAFREALVSYPVNASKRSAYRGLSILDRIAKAQEDGDDRTLAAATVKGNYLDPLRGVFDWAKRTGRIKVNPFEGITITESKAAARRRERQDFTDDQLGVLFSAPLFTGAQKDSGEGLYKPGPIRISGWRYWLPIIALFSGARLNELCGLMVSDFEQQDGIAFFHIRESADRGLKTKSSIRIVPIHQALIDLGLLLHVDQMQRAGECRVFPDLEPGPRGYLSHKPSKFYGRLIARTLGDDAAVVFHSFRHTFITRMRKAGVPREVRTALVGHEDNSTHEGYGTEPITRLNDGVQAVRWNELDLARIRLDVDYP